MNWTVFTEIARQMFWKSPIQVEGQTIPIQRTSRLGLRKAEFTYQGEKFVALEQNPQKMSEGGLEANRGAQVVQFKNQAGKYIGRVTNGKVKVY